MKLVCLEGYKYGTMPRLTTKQAKDIDLDPKVYHGGPVQVFEAGETYEVDRELAVRLLRDFGPKRGRTNVKFQPADPTEYIEYLTQGTNTIPMDAVLAGALAARDDGGAKKVDVDV